MTEIVFVPFTAVFGEADPNKDQEDYIFVIGGEVVPVTEPHVTTRAHENLHIVGLNSIYGKLPDKGASIPAQNRRIGILNMAKKLEKLLVEAMSAARYDESEGPVVTDNWVKLRARTLTYHYLLDRTYAINGEGQWHNNPTPTLKGRSYVVLEHPQVTVPPLE